MTEPLARPAVFIEAAALSPDQINASADRHRLPLTTAAPGVVERLRAAGFGVVALLDRAAIDATAPLEAALVARLMADAGLNFVEPFGATLEPAFFPQLAQRLGFDLDSSALIARSASLEANATECGLTAVRIDPDPAACPRMVAPSLALATARLLARRPNADRLRSVLDQASHQQLERGGDAFLKQRAPT